MEKLTVVMVQIILFYIATKCWQQIGQVLRMDDEMTNFEKKMTLWINQVTFHFERCILKKPCYSIQPNKGEGYQNAILRQMMMLEIAKQRQEKTCKIVRITIMSINVLTNLLLVMLIIKETFYVQHAFLLIIGISFYFLYVFCIEDENEKSPVVKNTQRSVWLMLVIGLLTTYHH